MYYKTEFQTYAIEMEAIVRAFNKIGLQPVPLKNSVPADVIRDILYANPEQKNAVISGRAEFVPLEHEEWRNGDDIITATDYELREPIRVTTDPFIRVLEVVPGRTSYLVKETLIKELNVDFIKFAYSRGPNSRQARQCVLELAVLKGMDPRELYERFERQFIAFWVKTIEMPSMPTVNAQQSSRMPVAIEVR